MTTFHFVRHGSRARSESSDPGLSSEGRAQASMAARILSQEPISHVYTSPLLRAVETARIFAAVVELEPAESELLRERANFGDSPGQTREEFDEVWARCSRDREFVPKSGDSSLAAGRRLERFIAAHLADIRQEGSVVAVTHGGVLADFLLNVFTPKELRRANALFSRDPYSGKVVRECSITRVRAESGALELLRIAAVEHLST